METLVKKECRTEQICFRCTPSTKLKFLKIKEDYNLGVSDTIEHLLKHAKL